MKFTYRWGDRPLDGYTLKRGLGSGGFGEVYYALSDGGKDVALKLIRGHSDIELRGITNCLNFKHPNLVHLYDLRTDGQGQRWLVMEYIAGEPLNAILGRHRRGLPVDEARRYFMQVARAVAYLHDHGVIHRDIKPANLFVEEGRIKLGDYGLSKSVGQSAHSQSSNVGTIHYMAPEVAGGNYSKQIDIYACGVMLYEMLTGELPFQGETWAEIALKHQTDTPDLRNIPAGYAAVLEQALNKRAERRFADMNAMIDAVQAIDQPGARPTPTPMPVRVRDERRTLESLSPPGEGRHRLWSTLAGSLLAAPLVAVPTTAIWAVVTGYVHWGQLGVLMLLMIATSWAVLIATRLYQGQSTSQSRRLLLACSGAVVGAIGFWLDGWATPELWLKDEPLPEGMVSWWGNTLRGEPGSLEMLAGYMAFFAAALFIPRWWLSAEPRRKEHFTLFPLFATGICSLILIGIWKNWMAVHHLSPPNYLVLAVAGAAAVIQIVSPFIPPQPPRQRTRQRLGERRWA